PQLGVGFLADVRVVLARQPAKRPLDLIGAGVARHAQGFVIVLELQPAPPGHAKISSWVLRPIDCRPDRTEGHRVDIELKSSQSSGSKAASNRSRCSIRSSATPTARVS